MSSPEKIEPVYEHLQHIVEEVFTYQGAEYNTVRVAEHDTIDDWMEDSLDYVELVVMVEDTFGVDLDDSTAFEELKTFTTLAEWIVSQGGAVNK